MSASRRMATSDLVCDEHYFRSRVALTFNCRGADLARWAMEIVFRFAGDWLSLYNAYLNILAFWSFAYLLIIDRGSSLLCLSL